MLGKATPKIGDRVDELVGNIHKKLYRREGGEQVRGEIEDRSWRTSSTSGSIHAEGEVLDRPAHARIARCQFTPRGRLVRLPT
jgi:hypothetical protein